MSASLVGSEMCIRDRLYLIWRSFGAKRGLSAEGPRFAPEGLVLHRKTSSVSYTHLTLPTICSV
eukprot:2692651-Alexandrium_andersonii.AAC.1